MEPTTSRQYTDAEKRAFVKKLAEGRRRARAERPKRLAAIEKRMGDLEVERKLAAEPARRADLIYEIAALGRERSRLKWGE